MSQCAEVVEDEKASAKGCSDKIVFAPLNRKISKSDRWRAVLDRKPVVATVDREEKTQLSTHEQQVAVEEIFDDAPNNVSHG